MARPSLASVVDSGLGVGQHQAPHRCGQVDHLQGPYTVLAFDDTELAVADGDDGCRFGAQPVPFVGDPFDDVHVHRPLGFAVDDQLGHGDVVHLAGVGW